MLLYLQYVRLSFFGHFWSIKIDHNSRASFFSCPSFSLLIQTLSLRQNLIKKIENLESLTSLRELDLYDNQIRKLESLSNLKDLE